MPEDDVSYDDDDPHEMTLHFSWDSSDADRLIDEGILNERIHWGALYAADGKEARDALEQLHIYKANTRDSVTKYEENVLGNISTLEAVYERYRKPTTVGEITQTLSREKLASSRELDEGGDPNAIEDEEAKQDTKDIENGYRTITGRRISNLPPAVPIVFDVPWVTHVIASLFRDGSSAGWKFDPTTFELGINETDHHFTLRTIAPLSDVGWIFSRLLSEPTDVFDTLILSPNRRVEDTPSDNLFRKGIRMWRGTDLLSGMFTVEDAAFRELYPEVAEAAEEAKLGIVEEDGEEEEKEEPVEGKEEKRSSLPRQRSKRAETREEREEREEAQRIRDETNVRSIRGLDQLPGRAPVSALNYIGRRSPPR